MTDLTGAGWSSLAARRAHNPKVVGSNPTPATNSFCQTEGPAKAGFFIYHGSHLDRWRLVQLLSTDQILKRSGN